MSNYYPPNNQQPQQPQGQLYGQQPQQQYAQPQQPYGQQSYAQQPVVVNVVNQNNVNGGIGSGSRFDGGLLGLIGISILCFLLIIFTFGLGLPWATCIMVNWYVKHTVIDGRRMAFDGTGGQLFGKYIIWWLLTIVTFGIYGLWLGIKMVQWIVSHIHVA